jgi:hypothetical protein
MKKECRFFLFAYAPQVTREFSMSDLKALIMPERLAVSVIETLGSLCQFYMICYKTIVNRMVILL